MNESNGTVVWSIAGSDSGAGAGVQADLRAFDAFAGFEVHGCTAVAAITAQNSVGVERIDAVATEWLDAQLAALASDLPPRAIKTGLLGSVANVRCVAAWVDRLRRERPVALVVDPVWRASTGLAFTDAALRGAVLGELLPRADVITPNRAEAAWLLGWSAAAVASPEGVEAAAAALRALGAATVVVTGGDASGEAQREGLEDVHRDSNQAAGNPPRAVRSMDWIDTAEARGWLSLPRVETAHHHGSGCVFAASMAAAFALDFCAADAAVIAKMNTTHGLRHGFAAGRGAGAVRPQRGFGWQPDLLPWLRESATDDASTFTALSEPQMGLYAVVDSAAAVERVLAAGVRTVQLRIKEVGIKEVAIDDPRIEGPRIDECRIDDSRIEAAARADLATEIARSVHAARAAGAQLFVNDHWRLAIEHGAYGVHLGQEDLLTADMPALRAAGLRVGISTHSFWEVCRAHAFAPSYIACGPIHATVTKDMPWRPQGAGNLAYWCRVLREPVVAIAGMDPGRSHEASRCGAAGVAMLRGVAQAADLGAFVSGLQAAIASGRSAAPMPVPELPRSTLPRSHGPGRAGLD